MTNLDLNHLRQTLRENAQRGDARPDDPRQKIVVGRDGKIRHGDDIGGADRRALSEVPQELFADGWFGGDNRISRDRDVARAKLPAGTREVNVDGTTAFVYSINDEFGETYTLCAYYDGGEYQVKVVSPAIESEYGVGNAHIFGDGRLCLRPPAGGMPSLADAYGRSVLWANGFSILRRTGEFPWPAH